MTNPAAERVDLPVSGMTCAACARAIERDALRHRRSGARQCESGHQYRHRGVRRGPYGRQRFHRRHRRSGLWRTRDRTAAGRAGTALPNALDRGDSVRRPGARAGDGAHRSVGPTGAHAPGESSMPARLFTLRRGARLRHCQRQHEHADRSRDRRGVPLFGLRDGARRTHGVFRSCGHHHRPHSAGPYAGKPGALQSVGSHPPHDGSSTSNRASVAQGRGSGSRRWPRFCPATR